MAASRSAAFGCASRAFEAMAAHAALASACSARVSAMVESSSACHTLAEHSSNRVVGSQGQMDQVWGGRRRAPERAVQDASESSLAAFVARDQIHLDELTRGGVIPRQTDECAAIGKRDLGTERRREWRWELARRCAAQKVGARVANVEQRSAAAGACREQDQARPRGSRRSRPRARGAVDQGEGVAQIVVAVDGALEDVDDVVVFGVVNPRPLEWGAHWLRPCASEVDAPSSDLCARENHCVVEESASILAMLFSCGGDAVANRLRAATCKALTSVDDADGVRKTCFAARELFGECGGVAAFVERVGEESFLVRRGVGRGSRHFSFLPIQAAAELDRAACGSGSRETWAANRKAFALPAPPLLEYDAPQEAPLLGRQRSEHIAQDRIALRIDRVRIGRLPLELVFGRVRANRARTYCGTDESRSTARFFSALLA